MAIYRPSRPRWPLAVAAAVVGGIVGLVVGLLLGGDGSDPTDAARETRSALAAAAGTLEVVSIEYSEAVEDGAVAREAEYEGSLDALASSHSRYQEVAAAVEALAPERAADISSAYEDVEKMMRDRADESAVADGLEELSELLKG